jgi:hypothetical protein
VKSDALGGRKAVGASAVFGFGLAHPHPQALVVDAQITHARQRRLDVQTLAPAGRLAPGTRANTSTVLPWVTDSFLQDAIILETEPPSNPGRFTSSCCGFAEFSDARATDTK